MADLTWNGMRFVFGRLVKWDFFTVANEIVIQCFLTYATVGFGILYSSQ